MTTKYLYAVRFFKNKKWYVMQYFSNSLEANVFAQSLEELEWDIKKVTYAEAVA